jgi:hypothetical protein
MSETDFTTLPTDTHGKNGSGDTGRAAAALDFQLLDSRIPSRVLDPWIEDMHECERCEKLWGEPMQIFRAGWEIELNSGAYRVGVCLGCGQAKVSGWTRTNGTEAA